MIVADLKELLLHPVADRAIPNSERIPIQVNEQLNLGQYGVMVGYAGPNGFATPIRDNLYWFGDGLVNPGDWIFLYTGNGSPRTTEWGQSPGNKIYTIHWGRPKTMFANSQIVPLIFRADAAVVGLPPGDLPQVK